MGQSYSDLLDQVILINSFIGTNIGRPLPQIQKIYSTAKTLCFSLRTMKKTHWITIGRGKTIGGIWNGESPPPSDIRVQDNFLNFIRKSLKNRGLKKVYIHPYDRVVCFETLKQDDAQYLTFFWRGPSLFFVLSQYELSSKGAFFYKSWNFKKSTIDEDDMNQDPFDYTVNILNELGLKDVKDERRKLIELDEIFSRELQDLKKLNANSKVKKKIKRKKQNILNDIKKCQKIAAIDPSKYSNLANLSDLYIDGTKIKLNKTFGHYKNLDILYKKIKSHKRGLEILGKRLAETDIEKVKDDKKLKYNEGAKVVSPVWNWGKEHHTKKKPDDTNMRYKELHFQAVVIRVGLDASSNDQLRNKWANKEDYWAHLEGVSSAHAIVRSNETSDDMIADLFQIVGSCLRDLVGRQALQIPLIYTRVRNLKGVKGKRGSVFFKKEKRLTVSYTDSWKNYVV